LTSGLSVITWGTDTVRVGLGFAACTQPHDAHEPQAMIAFASFDTHFSFSRKGFPPWKQYIPSSPRGGLPSTATM
jgi:hypothetical protein